jgi:hypothetical protein
MKGYLHAIPPRVPGEWLYTGDWGFVVSKVTNYYYYYSYIYIYIYTITHWSGCTRANGGSWYQ